MNRHEPPDVWHTRPSVPPSNADPSTCVECKLATSVHRVGMDAAPQLVFLP